MFHLDQPIKATSVVYLFAFGASCARSCVSEGRTGHCRTRHVRGGSLVSEAQSPISVAMACSLGLLLSRTLLLLHLVRGKKGVEIVGDILCRQPYLAAIKKGVLNAGSWKALLAAVKATLSKDGLPDTVLAHAEGLNAGYSGIHPLEALAGSAVARKMFDTASASMSSVIRKFLIRGYFVTSQDILDLWKSVRQNVVLAIRNGKIMKAGKYTSMSLARSIAHVATGVFKRPATPYSEDLHATFSGCQSRVRAGEVEHRGDVLGRSVFGLFYMSGYRDFVDMWKELAPLVLGQRCLSLRLQSEDSVTWQTLLVHMCEVRQCLQKYGLEQLQRLMKLLGKADEAQLRVIRADHASLMDIGYAGGSKCHAVWMVERAACAVGFSLARATCPKTRGTRTQMHRLLMDMASMQVSPKVSVLAIPEWRAMECVAGRVLEKCSDACVPEPTFDVLKKKARDMGHVVKSRHLASKVELAALVDSGRATAARRNPTIGELRKLVRKAGGNPQPRKGGTDAPPNWTKDECLAFISSRKRPLPE